MMDLEYRSPSSALIRTLKSGRKKIYIKDMQEKVSRDYGGMKAAIIDVTRENPSLLRNYRADSKRKETSEDRPSPCRSLVR